jgi:hypothetical protein
VARSGDKDQLAIKQKGAWPQQEHKLLNSAVLWCPGQSLELIPARSVDDMTLNKVEVYLNVYDVTNASSEGTNTAITRLNDVTRQIGMGGIFHGAICIGGVEFSYGYCERGSGVYTCEARKNPMYR